MYGVVSSLRAWNDIESHIVSKEVRDGAQLDYVRENPERSGAHVLQGFVRQKQGRKKCPTLASMYGIQEPLSEEVVL